MGEPQRFESFEPGWMVVRSGMVVGPEKMEQLKRVGQQERVLKLRVMVKGESVEPEGWVEKPGNPGESEGAVQT